MAVVGLLALDSPGPHERDAAMLHGFVGLDRPRVHDSVVVLAHLADPVPYLLVGVALIVVAVARGLAWRAGAVAVLLVATGVSTQAVKHLLAEGRVETWLGGAPGGAPPGPRGHPTPAVAPPPSAGLVPP